VALTSVLIAHCITEVPFRHSSHPEVQHKVRVQDFVRMVWRLGPIDPIIFGRTRAREVGLQT
jgi:hypothetical protein